MCLLTSPILSFPSSAFLPSAPCVMLSSTLPVNHQWMAVLNVSESAAEDNRYQNRTTILHNQCVAKQCLHAVRMMNHGVQCFNFAVYYIHTPFMSHADNVHMPHHINLLASSPDHSQILYDSRGEKLIFLHSCEIKSGSGLGMRLSIYYVRNRGPHYVTETIFQGPGIN